MWPAQDNLVVNVPNCFTDFCCEMNVTGTGVVGGIASAAMACVPGPTNLDAASMPLIYMGDALYALSSAFSGRCLAFNSTPQSAPKPAAWQCMYTHSHAVPYFK